ncbi:hypothetical protein BYT27DRAFT_7216270 [Phlegmacium glaucopus]|nr:hypothetical protein BYT27DRAFT_7216270 [Phlegmacium glaucopus]
MDQIFSPLSKHIHYPLLYLVNQGQRFLLCSVNKIKDSFCIQSSKPRSILMDQRFLMPRPTAAAQAKKAQLATAREKQTEAQTMASLQKVLLELNQELLDSRKTVQDLEISLVEKERHVALLSTDLRRSQESVTSLLSQLKSQKEKYKAVYHELRIERQARKCGVDRRTLLEQQIDLLKSAEISGLQEAKNSSLAIKALQGENQSLQSELSQCLSLWEGRLHATQEKFHQAREMLKQSVREITWLKKARHRADAWQNHAVWAAREKLIKETNFHKLMHKGVYTEDTRNLVRLLVKAGCSQQYVNKVIVAVLKSAGIKTVGSVSRTTIARIMREGFFAAQIQLGYEMQNADGMTFSADGTGHRSINYNSRHVNLIAEDYSGTGEKAEQQHVTRFLGIQSSLDGSSKESIKDWEKTLKAIVELYNRSPFGKRNGNLLRIVDILIKLAGMHSDHCAKEKKDAQLMEKKKEEATNQVLGEKVMLDKTEEELLPYFQQSEKAMIKAAGGKEKWKALSEEEQAEKQAVAMEKLVIELGREAFDMLSDDEKRILKLFIWAGCGCHKDLNTVRGGGGVKATQLAGAIFNHKDDKKGHHDTFRWWWYENIGTQFTFPDTSNTQFQSHCDAAAVLLLHLPCLIEFLTSLCDNKQSSKFNHMEQNLWNALHCSATKTELAVMALYSQAISHPYMKVIHASGKNKQNMLDLGPFHKKVYSHMQRIIGDPTFLIGPTASFEMGSLDGEEWHYPDVIKAINKMEPELPYLKPLLVTFFKATVEEKKLAWMPATNDVDEGALGSFRVLMRKQPQLTLLQHNALAMFFRNDTEAFMAKMFTEKEDYAFLHKMAQESQGEEKQRKNELVDHREATRVNKLAKKAKKQQTVEETKLRLAGINLILDKDRVTALKGKALKDHLKAFHSAGAPNLQNFKQSGAKVEEIRQALRDAVDLYNDGKWNPLKETDDTSESGEEFDFPEEGNEDIDAWESCDDD